MAGFDFLLTNYLAFQSSDLEYTHMKVIAETSHAH